MSSAKTKPRRPARRKSSPPSSPATVRTTVATKTPRPQTTTARRGRKEVSSGALRRGTKIKDADGEAEESSLQLLLQVQSLLAQIWHRNKNQHRGQKWWKWVGILKRGVRDFVELAGVVDEQPSELKELKEKGREEVVGEATLARRRMQREREAREQRVKVQEWVREVVLGRCWLAFSTLVADPQFSALGVVLLAILARVGRLVGLPTQSQIPAVSDLTRGQQQQSNSILATSLAQTGVDRGEVVERAVGGRKTEHPSRGLRRQEGKKEARTTSAATETVMGRETGEEEAKRRPLDTALGNNEYQDVTWSFLESAGGGEAGLRRQAVGHAAVVQKEPTEAVRKKKRRKKGNAIDELFAGLS